MRRRYRAFREAHGYKPWKYYKGRERWTPLRIHRGKKGEWLNLFNLKKTRRASPKGGGGLSLTLGTGAPIVAVVDAVLPDAAALHESRFARDARRGSDR